MLTGVSVAVAIFLAVCSSPTLGQDCPCYPYGGDKNNIVCADESLTSIPDCVPSNTPILTVATASIPLVSETLKRFTNLNQFSVVNVQYPVISLNLLVFRIGTLEHFNIWGTKLDYVDNRWYTYAPGIKTIQLFSNQISSLSEDTFRSLPQLYSVDLKNNLLTTLPTNLFVGTSLTYLNLDNNPWHCDCEMAKFMVWTRSNGVTVTSNATCWQPFDLRGLNLLSLNEAVAC